jgi:hypothetical protein
MSHLKALQNHCIVRLLKDYDNDTIIHVDLTDKKNLKGEVISVGPELEHIQEGDVIWFSDAVKKLDGVVDETVYRVAEDAIICKVV